MADETGRFEWVGKLARLGLIGAVLLVGLAAIGTIACGIVYGSEATRPGMFWLAIAIALLAEAVSIVWLFVGYGIIRSIVSVEAATAGLESRVERIETLMADQLAGTRQLVDLASLSDRAKGLVFREREIEAVREMVHHDMIRQDYKTAEAAIESLERDLGYVDEANRLREALQAGKKATLEEKIDAAIDRVQDILNAFQWGRAIRESNRIMRLFPDNPKVASLPERIETARAKRKRDLLQAYGAAVRRNDVDLGVALLKELDLYLTPQEGAALADSARGVFKARLHNLGVQFAIRITDKNWAQAVAVGQDIITEYPNSRMAREVRDRMDLLRQRAAVMVQQPAPAAPEPPAEKPPAEKPPAEKPPVAEPSPAEPTPADQPASEDKPAGG